MIFGRKPRMLIDRETGPNVKVSGVYKEYYELSNKGWDFTKHTVWFQDG